MSDDTDGAITVVCTHCRGDGVVAVERMAIIGGVPQTVLSPVRCEWCDGGRRRGFDPPV